MSRSVIESGDETTPLLSNPLQVIKPRVLAQLNHLDLSSRVVFKEEDFVSGGGYGDVFKGCCTLADRSEVTVAIKRLRFYMKEDIKTLFEKEIYVWSKLRHTNILPLIGYAFANGYGYPLLVSEWMDRGSAWTYVLQNPNCNLLHLVTGIARGLAYLHEKNVVHSDIKSDNILVSDSGDALICDFGCSRMITASQSLAKLSSGLKGTPRYQAYELLAGDDEFKGYTKEADVWAFGMTVYELLGRQRPYAHLSDSQVLLSIVRRELPSPPSSFNVGIWHDSGVRRTLWDLCQHCWIHDPSIRIDMASVLIDLRVPRGRRAVVSLTSERDSENGQLATRGLTSTTNDDIIAEVDERYRSSYSDLLDGHLLQPERRKFKLSSFPSVDLFIFVLLVFYIVIILVFK